MLQPMLRPLLKLPRPLLLIAAKKMFGMSPADTRISPVFDSLKNLPPTLIQVSRDEMLYSDAERYVGKARAAGTDITLQSWANMPHVFQIFDDLLPEAHHAFDEAADFLKAQGF
ncbi:alpha/beta hydrolase [Litorimonas sp. RW-G-Af-16]